MKKTFTPFLVLLLALWAAPAAAAFDEAGAAALKKLVDGELLWRTNLAKISGHGPAVGGEVTVTPKPSFYEVKIPGLSIHLNPQEKLDVGTVTVNAVPGKDGEWMATVALPPAMTVRNAAQQAPLASIALGTQRLAGAWSPAKGLCPRFDSLYQNITVKIPAENTEMSIGALKAMANLKENADGTWTGPGSFEASDVKIAVTGPDALQFNIRKIGTANLYDRLDISRKMEISKKIQALAAAGQAPTEQKNLEFINGLLDATQGAVDGFRNSFSAEGILLRTGGDPAKGIPAGEYALDKMAFEGKLQGGRQEKAAATFKGGFNGVRLPAVPGDLAGLVPQTLNIALDVSSLPLQEITAMMFDNLQKLLEVPGSQEPPEARVQAIFDAAVQAMQRAGTSLSIKDTFLKSRDMEASLTGDLAADPTSALGAAGKISLSVKGLDETMEKLQAAEAAPGADPRLKGAINGLSLMMLLGQSEKIGGGKAVYTYSFDIKKDSEGLLNSINILSPGARPQQTPIPPAGTPAP